MKEREEVWQQGVNGDRHSKRKRKSGEENTRWDGSDSLNSPECNKTVTEASKATEFEIFVSWPVLINMGSDHSVTRFFRGNDFRAVLCV